MRTSKLLELSLLLSQYAETVGGAQQLMARAFAKKIMDEARKQEQLSQKRET
jgi:hypothetical protein